MSCDSRSPSTRRRCLPLLVGGLAALTLLTTPPAASAAGFQPGDVLVSLKGGTIQWWRPDGTYVGTLQSVSTGHAEGMAFNAAGELFVTHWYTSDLSSGNTVARFDASSGLVGTFGGPYDCNPRSLTFDAAGHAFVGQSDCSGDVLELDASGQIVARYDVPLQARGSDWVQLAPDGCTLLYTSQGRDVLRYDICLQLPLPNFNVEPLPDGGNGAHGLKLLADGGLLVANFDGILRLNEAGEVEARYDVPGGNCFLSVDLDPQGQTLWTVDWCGATVYRFDLASGALVSSFATGADAFLPKAIVVVPPGPTPTPTPSPTPTPTLTPGPRETPRATPTPTPTPRVTPSPRPTPECCGRMTGGGSVFTAAGQRVTHGFELRCCGRPNRLQVNWGGHRFHLLTVTSIRCSDDPSIQPRPPVADIDTVTLTGTGRYDGQAGATIEIRFTDAGEPGRNDTATITIRNAAGDVVLNVSNKLTFGNHQAHRGCPKKRR